MSNGGDYRLRECCGLGAVSLVGWGAGIGWQGRRGCGSGTAVAKCGNIVRRVDGGVGHVPVGGV